jgi:cyanophycinase
MANEGGSGKVGRLVVIGGAEEKEGGDMDILARVVELAGGDKARIIVCSSPAGEAEEVFETYRKVFENWASRRSSPRDRGAQRGGRPRDAGGDQAAPRRSSLRAATSSSSWR